MYLMIDLGKVRSYIEDLLFPYRASLESDSENLRRSFIRDLEKVASQRNLSYQSANRQLLCKSYRGPSVSKTGKNRSF